jgi:hypothetical protein
LLEGGAADCGDLNSTGADGPMTPPFTFAPPDGVLKNFKNICGEIAGSDCAGGGDDDGGAEVAGAAMFVSGGLAFVSVWTTGGSIGISAAGVFVWGIICAGKIYALGVGIGMESVFAADWSFTSEDFGRTMLLKGFCGARNLRAAGPTLGKYPGLGRHSKLARRSIVAAKKTATPEQRKYLPRRMKRKFTELAENTRRPADEHRKLIGTFAREL